MIDLFPWVNFSDAAVMCSVSAPDVEITKIDRKLLLLSLVIEQQYLFLISNIAFKIFYGRLIMSNINYYFTINQQGSNSMNLISEFYSEKKEKWIF